MNQKTDKTSKRFIELQLLTYFFFHKSNISSVISFSMWIDRISISFRVVMADFEVFKNIFYIALVLCFRSDVMS